MTTDRLTRYRTLLAQLLFERAAAGGDLAEDEESRFVERLDEVWWQLSAEEQSLIDRELAEGRAPMAADDLNLVDCEVSEGAGTLPRRAA